MNEDHLHAWIDKLRADLAAARERTEAVTSACEAVIAELAPVLLAAETAGEDCTRLLLAVREFWSISDPDN